MENIQKNLALLVGVVLTLVGIAGFFTGDSLLGFGINALHNVVHLVTGILGIAAATYAMAKFAVDYNKWLGVVYILVGVLGLVAGDFMASLLNINLADNLLHLVLGVVLAGVGFGVKQ